MTKKKQKQTNEKVIPMGIKLTAIYSGILAVAFAISAITLIFNAFKNSFPILEIVLILVIFLFTIIFLLVAKDLWKMKPWARTLSIIVLSIMTVFLGILIFSDGNTSESLLARISLFVVNIDILIYLFFNKEAKKAFSKNGK